MKSGQEDFTDMRFNSMMSDHLSIWIRKEGPLPSRFCRCFDSDVVQSSDDSIIGKDSGISFNNFINWDAVSIKDFAIPMARDVYLQKVLKKANRNVRRPRRLADIYKAEMMFSMNLALLQCYDPYIPIICSVMKEKYLQKVARRFYNDVFEDFWKEGTDYFFTVEKQVEESIANIPIDMSKDWLTQMLPYHASDASIDSAAKYLKFDQSAVAGQIHSQSAMQDNLMMKMLSPMLKHINIY